MNSSISIDVIQRRHDILFTEILQKANEIKKDSTRRSKSIKKVNRLLNDIKKFSIEVEFFDDFRRLSDIVGRWNTVFASIFETPISITLEQPQKPWKQQVYTNYLTENEVDNWIRNTAAFTAYARKVELGGQYLNELDDWHAAETFFASEVLEGRINFASRISAKSYFHLEGIWLKEVKLLMAYYQWLKDKALFKHHDEDFFDVCNHIRQKLLVNDGMKALQSEFTEAKDYIREHYLDKDGKIQDPAKEGSKLHQLIMHKAERIGHTLNDPDNERNQIYAKMYVKMFYDNIIPAVLEGDLHLKKEKTLRILKAFQYSKVNRFIIINCFETALAIYFLDSDIINDLWYESSSVETASWPKNFNNYLNESLKDKFEYNSGRIHFKGEMEDEEKEDLIRALNEAGPGRAKKEHLEAIEELYWKSQYPESTVESEITVSAWPEKFKKCLTEPSKERFRYDGKRIDFMGVMAEVEKQSLLDALEKAVSGKPRKEHIDAIEELYQKSRLIHEETTL
jgi:hypothetical protein